MNDDDVKVLLTEVADSYKHEINSLQRENALLIERHKRELNDLLQVNKALEKKLSGYESKMPEYTRDDAVNWLTQDVNINRNKVEVDEDDRYAAVKAFNKEQFNKSKAS